MESQQAAQQERLVEVRVDPLSAGPARHHFTHTRTTVAVMLVVVLSLVSAALAVYFTLMSPCKQDAAPLKDAGGINDGMRKLTESDEKGRYDVFTAQKDGRYFIYGWVNLTNFNNEKKIHLKNTFKEKSMLLETKDAGPEVFFFQAITLVNTSRISLHFNSSCTDSLFHIHEV